MRNVTPSRREFLRSTGTALAVVGGAGCASRVLPGAGGGEPVVEVGPSQVPEFAPETITVATGTTVTWVWRSDNHNVVPSRSPDGAQWDGTPGDPTITYGRGYTYETTFSVAGEYSYFCEPHPGMTGTVLVE